jgi:hypothetical protein
VRSKIEEKYYGSDAEFGVNIVDSEEDIDSHITEERVTTVVEENDMRIKNRIKNDLNQISSVSLREIRGQEVLSNIPPEGEEIGNVAETVSKNTQRERSQVLPAVVKIARFFAGEEDSELDVWDGRKLLELEDSGDLHEWFVEPTGYGKIIQANIDSSAGDEIYVFDQPTFTVSGCGFTRPVEIPDSVLEEVRDEFGL